MALANYTDLQAAIESHLHRSDLDSVIPDFIAIGESRLNRDIRCPLMEEVQTYSTSSRTLSLPSRFLQAKSLVRFDSGYPQKLVQLDSERFDAVAHDVSSGTPDYFNVGSAIKLNIAPASSTNFTLRYYKQLVIATDVTNWLLTKYPDAYLYAALLAAAPYVKDVSFLQVWRDLLGGVLKEINDTENRSDTPMMCESSIVSGGGFNIEAGE